MASLYTPHYPCGDAWGLPPALITGRAATNRHQASSPWSDDSQSLVFTLSELPTQGTTEGLLGAHDKACDSLKIICHTMWASFKGSQSLLNTTTVLNTVSRTLTENGLLISRKRDWI